MNRPSFFAQRFGALLSLLLHHTMAQTLRHGYQALVLVGVVSLAGTAWAQSGPQLQLPRTKLNAGMHVLDVQLAQTPDQRQIGLMWRKEMPQHEGMLFVFEQAASQCFWMRNTLIPLSAAFVSDDGTIVNIADMKPQSDDSHCSDKPVRFVLEMNVGWFAKRQIKAGYQLGGAVFKR
ncbi:hypothetical protein B9Z40_09390 [Limnohabitans sp. 15K]|nr:hypothetical protein B9Z40_09390 [Limnohabitans sp. 15K]